MRGWVAPGHKRLQNRMPHHAIVSDFRVGDFSIKARLNPRRITLLERLWVSAFVQRLRELGWVEGRNVAIEYRWAEGRNERYTEIATEFVRLKVDLIVTAGAFVVAAKQATSVIPIGFAMAADPLGTGLVASLARPGGNITGLSNQAADLAAKRLELLREVVPGLRRLAIMANVDYPAVVLEMREVETAAGALGLDSV